MVAIAFGLSMDYEVFLLSRIREDGTVPIQHPGGCDWAAADRAHHHHAATLLVVVIGAFATSCISFITMIGVGLALRSGSTRL